MKRKMKTLAIAVLMIATIGAMMTGCGKKKEVEIYVPESYKEHLEQEKNNEKLLENNPVGTDAMLSEDEAAKLFPTEEEERALYAYSDIVYALSQYDKGRISVMVHDEEGYIKEELKNQDAMKYCYEMLQQLECVDKWIDSPYCQHDWDNPDLNWNRLELLEGISIVEDVMINQNMVWMDAVGNEQGTQNTYFYYDANGRLISNYSDRDYQVYYPTFEWSIENTLSGKHFIYEYDENNIIQKINLIANNYGNTQFLVTPQYDSNGNKISDHAVYKDGQSWTFYYTYDGENRLIRVDCDRKEDYHLTWYYSYDESGRVVREQKDTPYQTEYVIDYTYDNNSVHGFYTNDNGSYTETHEVTLDEQGRIITWSKVNNYKYDYSITYGDCYIYMPVN